MLCAVAPQVCENETNEEVEAWDAACEARVAAGRAAVAVVGANAATGRLSRIERQASQAVNAAGIMVQQVPSAPPRPSRAGMPMAGACDAGGPAARGDAHQISREDRGGRRRRRQGEGQCARARCCKREGFVVGEGRAQVSFYLLPAARLGG